MERKAYIDKHQEETANPTKKSGKAGPSRWELEQYRYKEKPTDYQRPLHGDPRSKSERPQLDELDNDFSDDDGDHGYSHPAFGIGTTPDLYDIASSASDQGTLAGDEGAYSRKTCKQKYKMYQSLRARNEAWRAGRGIQMTTEQLRRQFAEQAAREQRQQQ